MLLYRAIRHIRKLNPVLVRDLDVKNTGLRIGLCDQQCTDIAGMWSSCDLLLPTEVLLLRRVLIIVTSARDSYDLILALIRSLYVVQLAQPVQPTGNSYSELEHVLRVYYPLLRTYSIGAKVFSTKFLWRRCMKLTIVKFFFLGVGALSDITNVSAWFIVPSYFKSSSRKVLQL